MASACVACNTPLCIWGVKSHLYVKTPLVCPHLTVHKKICMSKVLICWHYSPPIDPLLTALCYRCSAHSCVSVILQPKMQTLLWSKSIPVNHIPVVIWHKELCPSIHTNNVTKSNRPHHSINRNNDGFIIGKVSFCGSE